MDEGAGRSSSAARGRGSGTRRTVFTETESRGTNRRKTGINEMDPPLGFVANFAQEVMQE
jgi:hypothetical protein